MTKLTNLKGWTRSPRFLVVIHAVPMLVGCGDGSLPFKDYDPDAVAKTAISAFDTNNDGKLSEDELLECPSLHKANSRIDSNQDGLLDVKEIADRVAAYAAMSEYTIAEVLVEHGKRPVAGAEVTLKLADYMKAGTTKFVATTNAAGIGTPQSSPESLLGFPPGFYDVEVVHKGTAMNFGVEIADDNPSVSRLKFNLEKKQ